MAVDLGSIMATLKLNIDNFSQNMRLAEEQIAETEDKMSGFTKIGERISSVGSGITKGVTVPIIGVGVTCSKFFMDFQSGMAKIKTVADTSQVSIKTLGNQVIGLSDASGLGTKDLQAGLYDVLSAGVSTKDSMKYLEVAVRSAKGGFTDTATAVDGLTSTLNAYGLAAGEANKIANQMMVAQNLGKTTFGELSQSIGNVAPIANALKVKTTELFSAYAVLTANGIKTSEATSGLKAAFSNIIKPTTEATKAASAMGLSFDANTIKTKGLMPFLQDVKTKIKAVAPEYYKLANTQSNVTIEMTKLEKAGKKGTDQYKALAKQSKSNTGELKDLAGASKGNVSGLATMFGSVEALNSVLTLTSTQGAKLYQDSMVQMGDGTDRVKKAFDTMNSTPAAKLENAFNKLKNSGIAVGQALAPAIAKVSTVLSDLAGSINKVTPGQLDFITKLAIMAATVGPIIMLVGGMVKAVSTVATVFKGAGMAVAFLKDADILLRIQLGLLSAQQFIVNAATKAWQIITSVGTGIAKAAAAAQWALNAAWTANPVGVVVLAIVALVAALVVLFNKNKTFHDFIMKSWAAIKSFVAPAITIISNLFKGFGTTVSNVWTSIKLVTDKVFTPVITFIKTQVTQIITWFNTNLPTMKAAVSNVFNAISITIKAVMSLIGGYIKLNIMVWKAVIDVGLAAIKFVFSAVLEGIKSLFGPAFNFIVSVVRVAFNVLKPVVSSAMSTIKILISTVLSVIKTVFSTVWNSIVIIVRTVWNVLKTVISTAIHLVQNTIMTVMYILTGNWKKAWSTIVNSAKSLFGGIINVVKEILSGIGKLFSNFIGGAKKIGSDIIGGIIQGIKQKAADIKKGASDIIDTVKNVFLKGFGIASPSKYFQWIGGHMMGGLLKGIKGANVKKFAMNLVGGIKGAFSGLSGMSAGLTAQITAALGIAGAPISWLPAIQQMVMAESGGNPNAINLTDSNAKAGHPSRGLLQTIPTTFAQWRNKSLPNDIVNPLSNLVAGINYIKGRYGSPYNTPGMKSMAGGGGYKGYFEGTVNALKGLHWVGEKGPELVDFSGGERVINNKDSVNYANMLDTLRRSNVNTKMDDSTITGVTGKRTRDSSMSNSKDTTNGIATYGSLLHADTILINNDMDVQTLAQKLAFYGKQTSFATGGTV